MVPGKSVCIYVKDQAIMAVYVLSVCLCCVCLEVRLIAGTHVDSGIAESGMSLESGLVT